MANHNIITRTVNGETDQRVVVRHPLPLARTISYGSNWNKIRIGVRLSTRRATAWTSPPYFYFGLASGTEALPGTAAPNHFVGIASNITRGAASSNAVFLWQGLTIPNPICGKFTNGTFTTVNVAAFQSGNCFIGTAGNKNGCIFLEITKGSPNYTLDGYSYDSAAFSHMTSAAFKEAIEASGNPVIKSLNTTTAIDEATYGDLDTICFSWLSYDENNAFEVSDFDYVVLS